MLLDVEACPPSTNEDKVIDYLPVISRKSGQTSVTDYATGLSSIFSRPGVLLSSGKGAAKCALSLRSLLFPVP